MRFVILLSLAVVPTMTTITPVVAADPPPLVESFLHKGQYTLGEQTLERRLLEHPKDDQARFGLGLLQVLRSVERLGQSLYQYGVKSDAANQWFFRLPVPKNPDPASISYTQARQIIDDFRRGVLEAERTLAGVNTDSVTLSLRLAKITLDLDGDGKATDSFMTIAERILGNRPQLGVMNPDLRVDFDRGDVAWLRSYCHVIATMAELFLVLDWEVYFHEFSAQAFAKPVKPEAVKPKPNNSIAIAEPLRLGRVRRHLLQVCAMNRETWRFIQAETDNQYEWLPSPRQQSVIGLPVRENQIKGWLEMIDELEAMLEGNRVVPTSMIWRGGNLNLKKFLNDPPSVLDFDKINREGIDPKYADNGPIVNLNALFSVFQLFDSPMTMALYFN